MTVLILMILLVPVTAQAGTWKRNSIGWWWQEDTGSWPVNQWKYIRGKWYAFDGRGYMRTGWVKDGSAWYYMNGSGAMQTGWQKVKGIWYYLDAGGKMAADTWIGSYYVNNSGAWVPGAVPSRWIRSGDRWWYRHSDGSYTKDGWETINYARYHFDRNGWMQTGWQKIGGSWYYLGTVGDGAMKTSQWIDESYLGSDGRILTSCWIGEVYVGTSGKITKNQWIQDCYVGSDGKKQKNQWVGDYYVGSDGKKVTSRWIGDSYVGADGTLARNQWIGDSFVDKNGIKMKDIWIGDRYLDADGNWDRTKPVRVPLESIRLQALGEPLKPGEETQIECLYYPENTTEDLTTAKWTSSDPSVATVKDGKITAYKAGLVKITLKVAGISRSVEILVLPEHPSGLTMKLKYPTADDSCLKYGEYADLSVFVQPGNYDVTDYVTFSVDDPEVLVLKPNFQVGRVWTAGTGETTVRATYETMEVSSQIKVIPADEELEELFFDKTILYLEKNQTEKLWLSSKPALYADSGGVKWGSTDESVAEVDPVSGIIAKKPGKATIYAELMGKRAECEVIVTGEEDVVEYSYDTAYADYLFEKINNMRISNGQEPFVWKEEDAVYASKVRVGMHRKRDGDIPLDTYIETNGESQDVQMVYGKEKDFTQEEAFEAMMQNSAFLIQLMKKTDQPLTAGCAVVNKKVDGKVEKRVLVFTIGPSEQELETYTREEREVYWTNWMGLTPEEAKEYLF